MSRVKKRIALGGRPAGPIEFTPAQMARGDQVYEHGNLSADVWRQLNEITNVYLHYAAKEKTALEFKKFVSKVQRLQKSAVSLRNELSSDQVSATEKLNEIKLKYFTKGVHHPFPSHSGKSPIDDILLHCLHATIDVTSYAVKHYPSDPNARMVREGTWWNMWIVCLRKILQFQNLPTTARKDASSQSATKPKSSDFVRLVEEIQNWIPAEFQRHNAHSSDALASAIGDAQSEQGLNDIGDEMTDIWLSMLVSPRAPKTPKL